MISPEQIQTAHRLFMENEVRGFIYPLALSERKHSVVNAILLLLWVWNADAYREIPRSKGQFLKDHKYELEEAIKWIAAECTALLTEDLRSINIRQHRNLILGCFKRFNQIERIGPTGTSKALHIINPHLFMLWDQYIRKAYGCNSDAAPLDYLEFTQLMQRLSEDITPAKWGSICGKCDGVSVPRLLDQYNYVRYTLRLEHELGASNRQIPKAERLLGVIRGIYEAGKEVVSPGWPLYRRMERLARVGDVEGMRQYYERCLYDKRGKWVAKRLQKAGCPTLESEYTQFTKIYGETDE